MLMMRRIAVNGEEEDVNAEEDEVEEEWCQ